MTCAEARRYQRPSLEAQVLARLRQGPASERTLAVLIGCEEFAISSCLRALIRAGAVVRREQSWARGRRGGLFLLAGQFADTG